MSVIAPVFSFGLNGYAGSGLALQDKAEKRLMQITIGIDIRKKRWTLIGFQITITSRLRMAERAIRALSAG